MHLYYRIALRQEPESIVQIGVETKAEHPKAIEQIVQDATACIASLAEPQGDLSLRVAEAKIAASITEKAPTRSRNLIPPTQAYQQIQNLAVRKQATKDKKEKIEINQKIRTIKNRPYTLPEGKKPIKSIVDLKRNLIGQVFSSDKKPDERNLVMIGDKKYINDLFFCFTFSDSYLIRTTATLTTEGIDVLKRYVKNYLMRSHKRSFINPSGRKARRKPRRYFVKKIKSRNTYDIQINGVYTHLNTKGKIEIFTPYNGGGQLVGESGLDEMQSIRLKRYPKFSRTKEWILETDNATNLLIARSVNTLAKAMQGIFQEN